MSEAKTFPASSKRPPPRRSMKRTWELGLLAKDMVRDRLKGSGRARAHLVERMGSLHGLPQKMGQILSLNELGEEGGVFTRLTEAGEALGSLEAFSEMERQLKRPLTECFRSVEGKGISASLAQVHRATLHDGRCVAVKVQYPGIEEALWTDLKALGWLSLPVGGLNRGFDLKAYQQEVGRMIRDELDYQKEVRFMRSFGALSRGLDGVEIPEVVEELSGDRIITMSWLEGESFKGVLRWSAKERLAVGEALLGLFLRSCFGWKILHADPHPGNYRFSRGEGRPRIGLLDFGCVKAIEDGTVRALRGLLGDLKREEGSGLRKRVLGRFLDLGFKEDLMIPMSERLIPLSRVLFEPFLLDEPFSMRRWRLGERVAEVLGPLRWNFRFAGPANLMLFMRAYQGLIQYLGALEVPVNWHAALDSVLEGGLEEGLEGGLEEADSGGWRAEGAGGRNLRVRVTENNELKVDLTFRGRAAGSLGDLIPENLRPRLEARGIDLEELAREAVASDFKAGELFRLEEGSKRIRVWLE